MTEQYESAVLASLKRAEPLAVLASLTIVISVFTFDKQTEFQHIYNYSTTATFMFIISFVFFVFSNLVYVKTKSIEIKWLQTIMTSIGAYFFLAIGILHLILIAYEFGLKDSQIFQFITAYVSVFFLAADIVMYKILLRKNALFYAGRTSWSLYIHKISYGVGIASATALSGNFIYLGFKGIAPIPEIHQFTLLMLTAMPWSITFFVASFIGTPAKSRKTGQTEI